MNENSKLCVFIRDNADWRNILSDKYHIAVKEESPYAIFNYGIGSDFSDPIVQEARGIIINTETLDVACFPFRKFGNHNESYADKIDWSTARVQDKIDGSIIKLWFDTENGGWEFSTNSVIRADKALANRMTGETYLDIIKKANNFSSLEGCLKGLDKNYTYIFELVSPETQVVIRYDKPHLYHIGTRNNITGKEIIAYIGIDKPAEYPLHSLDDCIRAAIKLNQYSDGEVHAIKKEGYVVVDGQWNRIKVKSPDYLMMHHLASNSNFSKERIVDMLRNKAVNIADICKDFPDFAHYFKYYDFKVTELEYQANVFCDLTRRIYEEYGHDKKEVALVIKEHRLAPLGFLCLKSDKSGKEILSELPTNKYCKYITDYRAERLSELFYRGKSDTE